MPNFNPFAGVPTPVPTEPISDPAAEARFQADQGPEATADELLWKAHEYIYTPEGRGSRQLVLLVAVPLLVCLTIRSWLRSAVSWVSSY